MALFQLPQLNCGLQLHNQALESYLDGRMPDSKDDSVSRNIVQVRTMGGCCCTCPEAELVKVRAAAVVGLTQVVTATVGRIVLDQLEASVPAGAGGRNVLRHRAT